jgi:hypothetical protein
MKDICIITGFCKHQLILLKFGMLVGIVQGITRETGGNGESWVTGGIHIRSLGDKTISETKDNAFNNYIKYEYH